MPEIVKDTNPDSPLCGFNTLPVDLARWEEFTAACAGQPYVWGGKSVNLGECPPRWCDLAQHGQPCDGPDCSGYAQALIRYATGGDDCPPGSAMIADWCDAVGLKASSAAELGAGDGVLRVAIHEADAKDGTGHIWFCVGHKSGEPPHTIESYGGHGPGSRPSDCRLESGYTLPDLATRVYCVCYLG